jgi:hypothetical protein
MGFAVDWARRAEDDLDRLPIELVRPVIDEVYRLAEDPVRLSSPPRFGMGLYQRFSFDLDYEGQSHRFTILFQYTQDELAIEVIGVVSATL